MHRILLSLLAAAVLVGGPPRARAEEPEGRVLTSLREAQLLAMEDRRLILVVLDPSLATWEPVHPGPRFTDEVLEGAAAHVLVVRLHPGSLGAAGRVVRKRYGLWDAVGASVAIDSQLALVARDLPTDLPGLLKALDDAEREQRLYYERCSTLGRSRMRPQRLDLAALHVEHYAFERAVALLEQLDREKPLEGSDLSRLADPLVRFGGRIEVQEASSFFLERLPGDPRSTEWRIERALSRVCPVRTALLRHGLEDPGIRRRGRDALLPLLDAVGAQGDAHAAAAVRMRLLDYLEDPGERVAHYEWITMHDPQGAHAVEAWYRLYLLAMDWNDLAEARALLQALIETHPGDARIVPLAREELLPSVERLLVLAEDPEVYPIRLETDAEPLTARPGEDLEVRVVARNVSSRDLPKVTVSLHVADAFGLRQRMSVVIDLDAGEAAELAFQMPVPGRDPCHAVLLAERLYAGKPFALRGVHLRVQPAR